MNEHLLNPREGMSSPPRRIAFISGLPLGGSTTFVLNITRELVRRHIPTLVVSPEKTHPFADDFSDAGIQVILTDERKLIYEDRISHMLGALKSFQPTVLIGCLGPISYEMLRYAPAGVHRIGLIQTDHQMFYDAISPYAGHLDAVAGVSARIAERLRSMKSLGEISRHELPYGVPMPEHHVTRPVHQNPLRLLYFGRLTNPQKRVYLLPRILELLQQAGIPFQWTIAGDGEERAFLERTMVTARKDQQVTFLGTVSTSEIPELLSKQDVMILPSDAEGLPLSLLEAMSHGVIPVVSDLKSGLSEVVYGSCGFPISINDTQGYARAIIKLHMNREELAAKSFSAHQRVVKRFSSEAMTDRWLSTLVDLPCINPCWPETGSIFPPMSTPKSLRYSPMLLPLRRLAASLRWD